MDIYDERTAELHLVHYWPPIMQVRISSPSRSGIWPCLWTRALGKERERRRRREREREKEREKEREREKKKQREADPSREKQERGKEEKNKACHDNRHTCPKRDVLATRQKKRQKEHPGRPRERGEEEDRREEKEEKRKETGGEGEQGPKTPTGFSPPIYSKTHHQTLLPSPTDFGGISRKNHRKKNTAFPPTYI